MEFFGCHYLKASAQFSAAERLDALWFIRPSIFFPCVSANLLATFSGWQRDYCVRHQLVVA